MLLCVDKSCLFEEDLENNISILKKYLFLFGKLGDEYFIGDYEFT